MADSKSPQRILVIDDEPSVCDAVRMLLTLDGYLVETAKGGEEALEKFDAGNFDLVVTDYAMPVMNGAELALAIKSRSPQQPVLMLTAFAPQAELPGVDLILSKPFHLKALREAFAKFLPSAA